MLMQTACDIKLRGAGWSCSISHLDTVYTMPTAKQFWQLLGETRVSGNCPQLFFAEFVLCSRDKGFVQANACVVVLL